MESHTLTHNQNIANVMACDEILTPPPAPKLVPVDFKQPRMQKRNELKFDANLSNDIGNLYEQILLDYQK